MVASFDFNSLLFPFLERSSFRFNEYETFYICLLVRCIVIYEGMYFFTYLHIYVDRTG